MLGRGLSRFQVSLCKVCIVLGYVAFVGLRWNNMEHFGYKRGVEYNTIYNGTLTV